MDQLCDKWRPYRSVASWYMWRFVEAKGTPSSAVAVATGAGLQQQQHHQHHHQHQQQEQQQQQQQQQQHPPQPQLLDPINSMFNLG